MQTEPKFKVGDRVTVRMKYPNEEPAFLAIVKDVVISKNFNSPLYKISYEIQNTVYESELSHADV